MLSILNRIELLYPRCRELWYICTTMEKIFLPELQALLSSPKKCVIFPHKNPDGDALGSTLALSQFLIKKGHQSLVISPNEFPDFLKWMPSQEHILCFDQQETHCKEIIAEAEVIFTLDFNALGRISPIDDHLRKHPAPKVMIDHHQEPEDYATLRYSDTTIGSTCEMVYNVLHQWDAECIDSAIATCLYTGIMTDSGSFRFPSTTAKTHRIVADLFDRGVHHSFIHQNVHDSSSYDRLQLLGCCLNHLTPIENLPAIYTYLSQENLDEFNFQKGDTEGFVNYGLSIDGIQLSVILIEYKAEGIIKMSFRSKGSFDVNAFAREHFSGGGHKNAAGGKSTLTIEETLEKLKSAVVNSKSSFE